MKLPRGPGLGIVMGGLQLLSLANDNWVVGAALKLPGRAAVGVTAGDLPLPLEAGCAVCCNRPTGRSPAITRPILCTGGLRTSAHAHT
jgi:hypothetical protein